MAGYVYLSPEGMEKLKKELTDLRTKERAKIAQQIQEAREKGDLSENAEYDAAKEAQGMLESRISKLEETMSNARILDKSKMDASQVVVLSKVKIKNLDNGKELTYHLVSENEADLKSGKISVTSPIGKGLLGKSKGDIAEIKVPNGKMKFEIMEISID